MNGWWCVRFGDSLAWVGAPSEMAAVRRSLELHPLGDWTDDARNLVVFPQDAYPDHTGRHDYTRAVLPAHPPRRHRSPTRRIESRIDRTLGRVPNLSGVDAADTKHRAGRRLGETELFAVRGRCPRQPRDGYLAPQGATPARNPRDAVVLDTSVRRAAPGIRDIRGRDDHRRPERIAITAVRQLVRLLESLKNTGALRTPIKGPFRRSPATVTSGGSRQRLRDVRIPSAVRLRTSGLESVRFRSAFGRIRRAARRTHRTRRERTPPHLHFVGSRNDVQSGTGLFMLRRSHPGSETAT